MTVQELSRAPGAGAAPGAEYEAVAGRRTHAQQQQQWLQVGAAAIAAAVQRSTPVKGAGAQTGAAQEGARGAGEAAGPSIAALTRLLQAYDDEEAEEEKRQSQPGQAAAAEGGVPDPDPAAEPRSRGGSASASGEEGSSGSGGSDSGDDDAGDEADGAEAGTSIFGGCW